MLLAGLLAMLAGGVLLSLALSRQVIAPLSGFIRSIERIRSGEQGLDQRLASDRQDEIGVMVGGFNRLLDAVADRIRARIKAPNSLVEIAAQRYRRAAMTTCTACFRSAEVRLRLL